MIHVLEQIVALQIATRVDMNAIDPRYRFKSLRSEWSTYFLLLFLNVFIFNRKKGMKCSAAYRRRVFFATTPNLLEIS